MTRPGILSRIFRRRPAPPRDCRDNSEDWRVGDLAVCINARWACPCPFDPRRGDVLRVVGLSQGISDGGDVILSLAFEGRPATHYWDTRAFRKARPDAEPCEDEFADLIKRPARPKVGV